MKHEGFTPGPWTANLASDHGDFTVWGPGPDDAFLANIGTEGQVIAFDMAEANAALIADAPALLAENARLRALLAGCADALTEAGKDFALASPLAARPNLYETHAQSARAALAEKP